jgi:hypothetical protein
VTAAQLIYPYLCPTPLGLGENELTLAAGIATPRMALTCADLFPLTPPSIAAVTRHGQSNKALARTRVPVPLTPRMTDYILRARFICKSVIARQTNQVARRADALVLLGRCLSSP